MKRYEAYKSTGLKWFPEIPNGWEWRFLCQVAQEQIIKKPSGEMYPVMTLSYGEIKRKKNIDSGLVPSNYDNYQMLYKGNIVLRLIDLQNDHTSLRTGLVKETGIITSAYTCIAPLENASYIRYLLHSYDTRKVFYGYGGGVRQSIGFKDIRHLQVPVPPRAEQDQIVRYLDWQVSKINRLISAKRKEIDLTREYLSVKIEDAFNSVIGTSSVMLPLGRYIRKIESGTSVNSIMGSANAGAPGVLSTSCVYGNCFNASQNKQVAPIDYERVSCPVRKDTVIVSRMNTPSLVGACGYSDKDIDNVFLPDRLWQVYFNDTLMPEFVWRYLSRQSVQSWFATIATGSSNTMKNITKLQFKTVLIPNIDLEKQKRVTEIIRKIMDKRNTSCQLYEKTISNLQDLRTRLISDVVTGQIDVRSIKVPDYELVDEVVHDSEDEEPEVE